MAFPSASLSPFWREHAPAGAVASVMERLHELGCLNLCATIMDTT